MSAFDIGNRRQGGFFATIFTNLYGDRDVSSIFITFCIMWLRPMSLMTHSEVVIANVLMHPLVSRCNAVATMSTCAAPPICLSDRLHFTPFSMHDNDHWQRKRRECSPPPRATPETTSGEERASVKRETASQTSCQATQFCRA